MKETRRKRILLTGGGTGGHLFPAIAAAQQFCREYPGAEVLFVGTKRKMDAETLERYGFKGVAINSYGLKGKNMRELVKALLVLPISCLQALFILARFRPDLVLGVGGYVTGPVVAMAKLCRRPTLIHEQNSVPGLANRKLAKLVDRVCVSLPASASCFPADKVVFTGNPVRENLVALAAKAREVKEGVTLLVLGGSQGARSLNRLIVEAFVGVGSESLAGINLIHQTGTKDLAWVKQAYGDAGRDVWVEPFFKDMDAVYSQADILVSRAGATTLAELATLGKPVILVPYPFAADNHQQKNAEYYVQGGGALLFKESELTAPQLVEAVISIATNREQRERMEFNQRRLAPTDAAGKIVAVCRQLINRDEL
ncbi:undecaprenyldiphospho-muramoylpentapeptide beta-N-acetylglucosaminyltransferase [Desulfotalea psychrophila]|uniref:UDP-N-acetylglucosamine--N-acetylmuramyl-(pentapeptide) pyrophosphoryl-undecaprenol N-acetylglucosamine transferase n=1 Tax=Desulfotalea psychrophila (strain LSv54 / DSM 12343) TaxID=177439 RepID=MURG_DESPS|nr:undecaprenyldiphospho-muramoylpentapeptide beta-N-acetylglucosaminyltransferase [Desulfotalea psychrophila]Q6AJ53.1 RecName: Full=UDP-N-acetylglucosamine--N-acetylmuramyl-(pentapeptide) pyrophosphoryl-undecaprenol N-acetylglucosamine transferase; AltName: Full=Undecaprenyl-PP-MurNAc-pentapeptide-UDPGlcNAc GlcNAc transferase [Desulfotalea psychrophila LSv54]CAG37627.1 related to peptidoglycan synthesis protein (MurG) [Desulfotalea psychrophila LSv54]